ncbi:hypothetical protein R6Q59_003659 [Mikania micrantha]
MAMVQSYFSNAKNILKTQKTLSASSNAQSSVGCGASTTLEVVEIIPTKKNPEIWKYYDLRKMSSGPNKARYKLCGSFFKHDANNTLKTPTSINIAKL